MRPIARSLPLLSLPLLFACTADRGPTVPLAPSDVPSRSLASAVTAPAEFNDGFEAATLGIVWQTRQNFGTLRLVTSPRYGGAQALAFTSLSGGQRDIAITRHLSAPTYGKFQVWYYDAAPGTETLYQHFILQNSQRPGVQATIGVMDYDAFCYVAWVTDPALPGGASGPNQPCGIYPQTSTTNVRRIQGWHQLTINSDSGTTRISFSIDGAVVFAASGSYRFDTMVISVSGPYWRPNTAAYYDNVSFTPSNVRLTVAGAGNGAGRVTSSPTGIACNVTNGVVSGTCARNFTVNTRVTLTAAPSAGSAFAGWSGGCTGTNPVCPVGLTHATTVTASFKTTTVPPAITPNSIVTTIAGTGVAGFSGDGGPATSAQLNGAASVAFGPNGALYISTAGDGRIRRMDPNGVITTVAGTGTVGYGGDGGPATAAQLHWPHADAVGPDGTVYIADYANCRVRKIAPSGIITTIAGNGTGTFTGSGPSGDGGPATAAQVCPNGLARTADGTLYVSEYAPSNRIRRIGTNGIITTIAGNGATASTGDGGSALLASIYSPHGIAVGPDGSIYVGENGGARIRRIAPNGIITTVAGTGVDGFSGDGGPATSAQIGNAYALTVGPDLALYFADGYGGAGNSRIRRVGPDGIIGTVAGTGVAGYGGDGGPAGKAQFWNPAGQVFAPDGALIIGDSYNNRVRRIK